MSGRRGRCWARRRSGDRAGTFAEAAKAASDAALRVLIPRAKAVSVRGVLNGVMGGRRGAGGRTVRAVSFAGGGEPAAESRAYNYKPRPAPGCSTGAPAHSWATLSRPLAGRPAPSPRFSTSRPRKPNSSKCACAWQGPCARNASGCTAPATVSRWENGKQACLTGCRQQSSRAA